MEVTEVLELLGKRVRVLREERQLTQEQLAEQVGVSRNFVSMIERGEKGVALETMIGLAEAFGMTLSELFLDVHGASPQQLSRVSAAVAGQPADVQKHIFAVLDQLLALSRRK